MNSSQFAQAYEQQTPWVRRDTHPLRSEILLEGAEQSKKFDQLLLNYLSGNSLSPEEATHEIQGYRQWLASTFTKNIYRRSLFDDNPDDTVYDQFYSEIMFHAANLSMSTTWDYLLSNRPIPRAQLMQSQIELACMSVAQTQPMAALHKKGELYHVRNHTYSIKNPEHRGKMALATQFDAMVAYLEVMKENPELAVLPAPPLFENSTHHTERNSDLICINTAKNTAHGIQVKMNASISKRRDHAYDKEYVTVVDGMHDLKNFVFARQEGTSNSIAVPMPGLYSAHFLTSKKQLFRFGHKKGTGIIEHDTVHMVVAARQKAFDLAELAPSVNPQVTTHLATLALSNLVELSPQ